MSTPITAEVTLLLARWKAGDRAAENALVNAIYPLLHEMSRKQLRRNVGMTLRTTDLAHEAYERIARVAGVDYQDREHFLAIAATVIRRVIVDHLRRGSAEKRGGEAEIVSLDQISDSQRVESRDPTDWLALDHALETLASQDQGVARVVELRLFGGLSVAEIAQVCASSTATVGRQWRFARNWIAEQLQLDLPEPG